MEKKITYGFILIIAFVLLNIFSRCLYEESWFSSTTFAKELNPFDIITLIVTTIVTLWLGWYVSKKLTEQRYQKEYIITDLKKIEEEINYIERVMESTTLDLQTLLGVLNKLKIYIDRFSKTIDVFQISSIDSKELNKYYTKLFIKSTDLDGDKLDLDEVNRNEINQVSAEFIIVIREMIFTINKH